MEESEEKKILTNLLREYEDVISSMKTQLEVSSEEHKNLKEEIFHLVSENQKLTTKLNDEYKQKLKDSLQGNYTSVFESEIVINLQNQLDLCKKEKERTLNLYETSLKLIKKLEEGISSQKEIFIEENKSKGTNYTSEKTIIEGKLKNMKEHLEVALSEREQLESDNIKYQTEIAKLKINLESNNRVIEQLKLKEEELRNKCLKTEQDYTLLNATFECVVQTRNELEKKIEVYSNKIQELTQKNNESKSKVEEALDIVEKALIERDSATVREVQLKEEIKKLHLCLEHVIEEAGKKVGAEVEETKKSYNSTLKELTTELSDIKSELEKKKLEHKRVSFKYKKLEKLNSAKLNKEKISLIKGSETEIAILENHLDSTYQELEKIKVKYEEILTEKNKLEQEFSRLFENHQTLLKDRESKEVSFEETIQELKSQIEEKVEDLNEATKRTEFFLNQVKDLQLENKDLSKLVENCNCNKLKAKIKKLNEIRIAQMTELEFHVESQMKLNETWKTEIKELSEKFEKRIKEVKKECNDLKAKNKKIIWELNTAKKKIYSLENV